MNPLVGPTTGRSTTITFVDGRGEQASVTAAAGRILVLPRPGLTAAHVLELLAEVGGEILLTSESGLLTVRVREGTEARAIELLEADPLVALAIPDLTLPFTLPLAGSIPQGRSQARVSEARARRAAGCASPTSTSTCPSTIPRPTPTTGCEIAPTGG